MQRERDLRLTGPASKKFVVVVLDGVGIGELPDAKLYGDEGSNTLVNTARAVGGLCLPRLGALGLGNIAPIPGVDPASSPAASYGKMACRSKGKDSTTGHWELAGLVLEKEFPTFPHGFPEPLMERFLEVTGCDGFLGNCVASGTEIIQRLGAEQMRTGLPIVYTSADSVFQIAAHEEVIPLQRLYEICRLTRKHVVVGEAAMGRVIARPFVGIPGEFVRTSNRRDFSLPPFGKTMLDLLQGSGIPTIGIGKIGDLYADRGLSETIHSHSNAEGLELLIMELRKRRSQTAFLMVNLVDFDTLYGHRNDPEGFAGELEWFDAALPGLLETLGPQDVLVITADHGNDPVTPSTDHSREYVPLLCYTPSQAEGVALGTRGSFADVAKTVVDLFGIQNGLEGTSFLSSIRRA